MAEEINQMAFKIQMVPLILQPREPGPQQNEIPLSTHGHLPKSQPPIQWVPIKDFPADPPKPSQTDLSNLEIICLGCGNSLSDKNQTCEICEAKANPVVHRLYDDKCVYCNSIKCRKYYTICYCICHCNSV